MRSVAWGGGLLLAGSIAFGFQLASPASAADFALPATPASAPQDAHLLIYGGFDGWQSGGFGHGGLMWSPGGLDKEGFIAKFMAGGGTYNYRAGTTDTTGYAAILNAAPGWHFKRGNIDLTVYAGLDIQNHRLRPDDLNNRSRGTHMGVRAGADLWVEPTSTTMASASISFASIGDSYWSRLAYGWRAFDNKVYIGPDVHVLGDDTYSQWRIGAHVTALKLGQYEWSFGAGFVEDSDNRSGIYGRVGLLLRR